MIVKFRIENRYIPDSKRLKYNKSEFSFRMSPFEKGTEFTLLLNYLELSVDEDGRVYQIGGYCPMKSWNDSSFDVPDSIKGLLMTSPLESGATYRINQDGDWPISLNEKTGWVCVGNFQENGKAVEFLNGCIAVLTNDKLVSLYLKPSFEK